MLDPMERISEVLFGLILVLTITGSLSGQGEWSELTYSRWTGFAQGLWHKNRSLPNWPRHSRRAVGRLH